MQNMRVMKSILGSSGLIIGFGGAQVETRSGSKQQDTGLGKTRLVCMTVQKSLD